MKKKIVLMGYLSRCPIAGVIWQHLHYIIGFQRLGFDVYYFEDTTSWPYDAKQTTITEDCSYAVEVTKRLAEQYGFHWGFRAAYRRPAETFGCEAALFNRTLTEADAVLNLCGAQEMTEHVRKAKCLVYVESDPGIEQIKLAKGITDTIHYLKSHHIHFTFGENIGREDCPLPVLEGIQWRPTRQPIILDLWKQERRASGSGDFRVTTVANWETKGKDIVWKNKIYYWSKTFEFLKFSDLPRAVRAKKSLSWEMATDMRADPASEELFRRQGWVLSEPHEMSAEFSRYRDYIQSSDAEWTVAKDQYIRLNTGWFSDRSACYLAAGRPVITQDTGFATCIPVGEGLFSFRSVADIQAAIDAILSDPARHAKAAEALARDYFDAKKVCGAMAKQIGI